MEATDMEVEVADAGAGGGTGSSAMTAPMQPTKKMIEDHEVSHLPFRNWRAACVRGRERSKQHRSLDKQETFSTFSIDYGFFGSPGETPLKTVAGTDLPVLVGCDRKAKAVFAHPVPRKGLQKEGHVGEYTVQVIVGDLNRLGYKKVNGKSDQENAILAACNAVKVLWKGEWIHEKAPKGDPGTKPPNGEVEQAVHTVRGIARTLKEHVEQYTRCVLDPKCPILAWLIEYAGILHYLFRLGEDGMAPYQRVGGKEWTIALPAFGESIDFDKKLSAQIRVEVGPWSALGCSSRHHGKNSWREQRSLRCSIGPASARKREVQWGGDGQRERPTMEASARRSRGPRCIRITSAGRIASR
jgi:hypothetical protein